MIRGLLYVVGMFLHALSYKRIKSVKVVNSVVLMGGPSVDQTEFASRYDCSISANLTAPESHCSVVVADTYFHCFSDPSIIENPEKRVLFERILQFASNNKNYCVIIPVQYLQYVGLWGRYLSAKVLVYNQYSVWPRKKEFSLARLVFPNMKTIFLDCALPWLVYAGAQKVFVAGFDASYGGGENKNYSSIASGYVEKNNNVMRGWGNAVMRSADMYQHIFNCWSTCEITYAPHSGYAKYLEDVYGD